MAPCRWDAGADIGSADRDKEEPQRWPVFPGEIKELVVVLGTKGFAWHRERALLAFFKQKEGLEPLTDVGCTKSNPLPWASFTQAHRDARRKAGAGRGLNVPKNYGRSTFPLADCCHMHHTYYY